MNLTINHDLHGWKVRVLSILVGPQKSSTWLDSNMTGMMRQNSRKARMNHHQSEFDIAAVRIKTGFNNKL